MALVDTAIAKRGKEILQAFTAAAKQETILYALAALATTAALLLRKLLDPLLGKDNPYHTLWLAVVFSAWYCGIGPSVASVIIGVVGIWYWFLPPYHSFAGKNYTEMFGMLGFLVFSAVIVVLAESTRRIIVKRERAEEELRKTQEKLEDRVKERTAALARKTAETMEKAALLDMANDAVFMKTAKGEISYWNKGAERLYGWTMNEALGHSATDLLHSEYPEPLSEIESRDTWEGEITHTQRDGTRIIVASRWTTLRDQSGNAIGWLEINTDITYRKRAEDAARSLSARILTLQDEERRRIARGLHDSLGQYLTALKLNLDLLSTTHQKRIASECSEMVDKCLAETRTISHLLHPPLLDEAGLGSAIHWYVKGFAQRSGIKVTLELPSQFGRLHRDVETALFRALQEGLTNVHRHSGSPVVAIHLIVETKQVRLEIKDKGQGMPPKTLKRLVEGIADTGVGLAGMRERMRELGGSLRIKSDKDGTLLRVVIPISEMSGRPGNGDGKGTKGVSAA